MMERRSLGEIGDVSCLCLGAGSYGSEVGAEQAEELLDAFVAAGGNFIDTAHIYGAWAPNGANGGCGNSEVVIGRWMRMRNCRDRMIIGTKGGHPDFATGEGRLSRDWIRRHLQESLRHLQTDWIDVYYLHRDDRRIPVGEILEWLQELVEAGLIRVAACSNWRTDRLLEARELATTHGLPLLAASQISWSLAQLNEPVSANKHGEQVGVDENTWDFHCRTGIPVAAYNAQAGGLFAAADHFDEADIASPALRKPGLVRKYGNDLTWRRRKVAQALAREKGCSTHHVALAWLLHQPFPTFPIIGPRNVAQLADSLRALEVSLSAREVEMLRQGVGNAPAHERRGAHTVPDGGP